MNLGMSVVYLSFPQKRESRDPRTEAVAPCSSQGQALDPAFRDAFARVTVTHCKHARHFRSDTNEETDA
jgi:hypothetical protein